ncbi:MAG: flagellar biosynthesis anti-sigma factor FlgM [Burkholderiaceae bacterium]|jgi:negative regulator of flagellin synthesis FlgM|nr:flagellar biosynthesis anti-sigma factor FlgM [Burkholderiaceae bacterium]
MTNPITQQARLAQPDLNTRQAMDKAQKKADGAPSAASDKPAAPVQSKEDVLSLSDVAQKAMSENEFDRVKVDSIKQAIREGNYPLNARRIAENFVAIEQMIQD